MKHREVYIYPSGILTSKFTNPYIIDLRETFKSEFNFQDMKSSKNELMSISKNFFRAELFWFNWIEDIIKRRCGSIRMFLVIILLLTLKALGKKIIWTLHNSASHKGGGYISNFMYRLLASRSDLIITHAKQGVKILTEKYNVPLKKILHFEHPVKEPYTMQLEPMVYDIFIWGNIAEYKGVYEFVEFVYNNKSKYQNKKILIIGKCNDAEYLKKILNILPPNIIFKNQYIEQEELITSAAKSKYILFTYKEDSVLSSGVLCDSIRLCRPIIAPNFGSFKDIYDSKFIFLYNSFEDIMSILDRKYKNIEHNFFYSFYQTHNWNSFKDAVLQKMKTI